MPIWYNNHRLSGPLHHKPGAFPLPTKVEAIQVFPQPTTVKGLQQFAGMMNVYHRFVPKAAHIMRPIYDALAGKPTNLEWTEDLQQAFTATKEPLLLCSHTHKLMHQQPLQLMLQEQQLGLSWNNTSAPGNQWPFSAANFSLLNRITVHSTVNCWLPISLFDTSGTSWRAARSHFTQTISL